LGVTITTVSVGWILLRSCFSCEIAAWLSLKVAATVVVPGL
jgi:hypothetical protein